MKVGKAFPNSPRWRVFILKASFLKQNIVDTVTEIEIYHKVSERFVFKVIACNQIPQMRLDWQMVWINLKFCESETTFRGLRCSSFADQAANVTSWTHSMFVWYPPKTISQVKNSFVESAYCWECILCNYPPKWRWLAMDINRHWDGFI